MHSLRQSIMPFKGGAPGTRKDCVAHRLRMSGYSTHTARIVLSMKCMIEKKRARWSWQIGSLFGISIRVHITMVVLLAWIAIAAPLAGAGSQQALVQWFLVVAVFGSIVVHELAHALVARRFGCPTREILLLPIGGIAQMERMPERPAQELLVAIAGPAASIAIAVALGVAIAVAGWSVGPEQPSLLGALVVPLFWSNAALALFNLLPAFPMDGGRVLRAALTKPFGRARATRIASQIGKVLAAVFVITGLVYGGVLLTVIGLFVWFAAEQESAMVALSVVLADATVADAMMRKLHVIDAATPLDDAAHQMLADGHRELPVSESGRIAGVVTVADLAHWMAAPLPHPAVSAAMHRDVPIVQPNTPLMSVMSPLNERGVVFVGDPDAIVGVLTTDQLATYASLHQPPRDPLRT